MSKGISVSRCSNAGLNFSTPNTDPMTAPDSNASKPVVTKPDAAQARERRTSWLLDCTEAVAQSEIDQRLLGISICVQIAAEAAVQQLQLCDTTGAAAGAKTALRICQRGKVHACDEAHAPVLNRGACC